MFIRIVSSIISVLALISLLPAAGVLMMSPMMFGASHRCHKWCEDHLQKQTTRQAALYGWRWCHAYTSYAHIHFVFFVKHIL
jgi:hypothetical protein